MFKRIRKPVTKNQMMNIIHLISFTRKFLTIVAIFAMLWTYLPTQLISAAVSERTVETNQINENKKEVSIDFELSELRKEDSKVFKMTDGSYLKAMYQEKVHYYNNGELEEIDNTLNENLVDYENKQNYFKVKLPKTLKDNKFIKVKTNDYSLDFRFLGDYTSNGVVSNTVIDNDLKTIEQLNSSIRYNNVQDNVDLEYILGSEIIKENIYVNSYVEDLSLSFEYKVKDLIPVENGFADNSGNIIINFDELYMLDANGEISYEFSYKITEAGNNKFIIEIVPSEMYLKNAVYPVVIDPTIKMKEGNAGEINDYYKVYDYNNYPTLINSNNDTYFLNVGRSGNELYRTYLDIDISHVIDKPVITYANLNLAIYPGDNFCDSDCQIIVKQLDSEYDAVSGSSVYSEYVDSSFGSNINVEAFDYEVIPSNAADRESFNFDITRLLHKWMNEGGSTKTLEIKALDESIDDYVGFIANNSSYTPSPILEIGYVDATGLVDYYTYHNQDANFAGTGYTNDYTGNVTFVHNDINTFGNEFSFSLSHIFDNNFVDKNIGYGKGWRLSFNEEIDYVVTDPLNNISMLRHINGDGSTTYFDIFDDCSVFPQVSVAPVKSGLAENFCALAEDGSGEIIRHYVGSAYELYSMDTKDGLNKQIYIDYTAQTKHHRYTDTNTGGYYTVEFEYDTNKVTSVTDKLGNNAKFYYRDNNLERIESFRINENMVPQIYKTLVYQYNSSDELTNIIEIPKGELPIKYQKEVWNANAGNITYNSTSSGSGYSYFTSYSSYRTTYSGTTKRIFRTNDYQSQYYYRYKSQELYDKVCFDKYRNDTSFGSDLNYIDEFIGNYCYYFDEGYDSHIGDDNNGNYYYGKSGFTSSTDTTLGSLYKNDKEYVKNTDNAYYYRVTSVVQNAYKNPNKVDKLYGWTTAKSDGNVGDEYRDYYQSSTGSFTDGYGTYQTSKSYRVKHYYDSYAGTYDGEWQDSGGNFYASSTPTNTSSTTRYYLDNNNFSDIETQATFTYNSNGLLQTVKPEQGSGVRYYYDNNNRVSQTESFDKDDSGSEFYLGALWMEYHFHETRFKNIRNDEYRYLFDNFGHTVNIITDEGDVTYNFYSNIFEDTDTPSNWNLNNKVIGHTTSNTITSDANPSGYVNPLPNLIKNPGFKNDLSYWSSNSSNITHDTNSGVGFYDKIIDGAVVTFDGNPNERQTLSQTTDALTGKAEDEIVVGALSRGFVPNVEASDNTEFGISIKLLKGTSTVQSEFFNFNDEVTDGQYLMDSFTAIYDYDKIQVSLVYKNCNIVSFDYVSLQVKEFKTKTEYNDASITDTTKPYNLKNGSIRKLSVANAEGPVEFKYENASKPYQVTKVVDEKNKETVMEYGDDNLVDYVIKYINGANIKTSFTYDSHGNTTSTKYGEGSNWFQTSTRYVSSGLYVDYKTDEFGLVINYDYDHLSGLLETITSNGITTTYTYDSYERLETATREGSINSYTYENGLLATIGVNGYLYEFIYNEFEQIDQIKVAGTVIVTYDYEDVAYGGKTYKTDRLLTQTYSNGDFISFNYNDKHEVTGIKFNNILRYEYVYDTEGKLFQYIDHVSNDTLTYTYNDNGALESISDGENTITLGYDDNSELNNVVYNLDGVVRDINYLFTTDGLYDKTTYVVNSKTISKDYVYDTNYLNRLKKVILNTGHTTINKTIGYQDNLGSTSRGTMSNRVNSISYDINGLDYNYTFDIAGNIIKINVTDDSGTVYYATYKYDKLNQLIREDIQGLNTKTYTYDNYGNIDLVEVWNYTVSTSTPTTKQATEDYIYQSGTGAWKDQLERIIYKNVSTGEMYSHIFTYDNTGNVIQKEKGIYVNGSEVDSEIIEQYTWDGKSLAGITGKTSYKYNDQGIRTSKTVYVTSGEYNVHEYFLDGDKVVKEEINYYVNSQLSKTDELIFTYDVDGTIISFNINGTEYFYIRNNENDITAIVDHNKNILVTYEYDAWGNIIDTSDSSGINLSELNPYRYRGYRFDEESSLYYLNSRFYDASIRRFISSDVIAGETGDILSHNMYAYAKNNPVMMTDPSGYWPSWKSIAKFGCEIAIGIAVGAAVGAITACTGGLGTVAAVAIGGAIEGVLSNGISNAIDGKPFFQDAGKAALVGTASAVVGFGIGKYGAKMFGRACFTAGTEILTENGKKNIEDIKVGDYVYATSPVTGETELKKVIKTFEKETNKIVEITVNGEVIETTEEHPFMINGRGFTNAGYLNIGDELVLFDGSIVAIDNIEIVEYNKKVTVYNFEVEDFHTYFVGENEVLVHNRCKLGRNMIKTGKYDNVPLKNLDAHHVFPQKFKKFFKAMDVDIDDAANGIFLHKSHHRKLARAYNKGWQEFINTPGEKTTKQVLDKGTELMESIYKVCMR